MAASPTGSFRLPKIMSKSIVIVVAVVAVVAAGGAYLFVVHEPTPSATVPAPVERVDLPATPVPSTPKPDHGSFQKRFQPSLPPAK